MEETSFDSTSEFVQPASMEEARAALEEIKIAKKELGLEKKEIAEETRQLRAEYSSKTSKRATAGKGVGGLVSKKVGKASKKVASYRSSYDRKNLAEELEPLEERRAAIEDELLELDRQKLEIEKWMSAQKLETEQEKAAQKAAKASETVAQTAQIELLTSLKERGILTEEEFEAEKELVLAGDE